MNNQIKLGIVCPYDYFRHGGVQEHIRAVVDEFRTRNYSVKVLTPLPPDKENKDPDLVITLGRSTMVSASRTSFEISISASPSEINEILEREQFDVINYHEPEIPLLASQILTRSQAINVATFHARMPDTLMSRPTELAAAQFRKSNAKHFDAVTAVSDAAAYHISKVAQQPIEIIPNGIQLDVFNPDTTEPYAEFDDDIKTILYIGRLEKRKGALHLLRAYRYLKSRHPDTRLVIASDGPRRQNLEEYVARYDIKDVHFLGFVSDEDKRKLLKVCDVFCSPALYGESFGIVLIEAMAMRVPIVAGSNPGYISVMKGTGAIGLVNPKQTTDLLLRLELLLYDQPTRDLFINWEKDYVAQFDYSVIVDKYQALYERLLSNA